MFGIGMPELIMILIIALVVIGPKKLPELANSLGRALGEFKKATSDIKETLKVDSEFNELKDLKKSFNDLDKPKDGETSETEINKNQDAGKNESSAYSGNSYATEVKTAVGESDLNNSEPKMDATELKDSAASLENSEAEIKN